jgi:hypothetical protein
LVLLFSVETKPEGLALKSIQLRSYWDTDDELDQIEKLSLSL